VISKEFVPRSFAVQDEEEIIRFYERNSSQHIALNFINALEDALFQLGRYPRMGSARPDYELDLREIRSWTLKKFPHLIYYEIQSDHIELWRILHPKRDFASAQKYQYP
jgi:toxin ParE1/3/4